MIWHGECIGDKPLRKTLADRAAQQAVDSWRNCAHGAFPDKLERSTRFPSSRQNPLNAVPDLLVWQLFDCERASRRLIRASAMESMAADGDLTPMRYFFFRRVQRRGLDERPRDATT
jgi:hypothetical protein